MPRKSLGDDEDDSGVIPPGRASRADGLPECGKFGPPPRSGVLGGRGFAPDAARAGSAPPAGLPSRPSGTRVPGRTRVPVPPLALLTVTERAAPACPDPAMLAGPPVRACGMGVAAPAGTGTAAKPAARTSPKPAATWQRRLLSVPPPGDLGTGQPRAGPPPKREPPVRMGCIRHISIPPA